VRRQCAAQIGRWIAFGPPGRNGVAKYHPVRRLPGPPPRLVPIDFTVSEDGLPPDDFGLEMLWPVVQEGRPQRVRRGFLGKLPRNRRRATRGRHKCGHPRNSVSDARRPNHFRDAFLASSASTGARQRLARGSESADFPRPARQNPKWRNVHSPPDHPRRPQPCDGSRATMRSPALPTPVALVTATAASKGASSKIICATGCRPRRCAPTVTGLSTSVNSQTTQRLAPFKRSRTALS
jgi:hypothetical protein